MNFSNMTNEEFDEILEQLVFENSNILLTVPGVYEAVSEHFNNDVLDRWAEENPDKSGVCERAEEP